MFVLVNAFSINMLCRDDGARDLAFIPVHRSAARNLVINHGARGEFTCAIGHADTARVVAADLGLPEFAEEWAAIAEMRPNVSAEGNSLIVAQYRGPRLPVGATSLPEGAVIEYWQVYRAAAYTASRPTALSGVHSEGQAMPAQRLKPRR